MFVSAQYLTWRNAVPPAFSRQLPFNVKIPVERHWAKAKRRYLLVLEHVDTEDLRSSKLLTGPSRSWLKSAIDLGMDYAKTHNPKIPAFAAVNFNFFKTYDLSMSDAYAAQTAAADRIRALVKKLDVTDVIIFGDNAAAALLNNIINDERTVLLRRGRPILHKQIWWTNTISPSSAYQGQHTDDEDEDEQESKIDHANLLGFVGRCVGNSLIRDIVYKFNCEAKVTLIDNIADFKKIYRRLMLTNSFSLDTETSGLGRIVNKVLTVQVAFDGTEGFVIPVDHKDAVWTPAELKMVVKGLRNVLSRDFDPLDKSYDHYIIGQNLKFDLTIVRQRFEINVIKWRVWDLMAGEFSNDENMKALAKCRTPKSGRISAYTLEWMCAWYGCDFYAKNAFSKDDRATIETRSLDEKGLLNYCSMDAQVCWYIHDQQKLRAANRIIKGRSYETRYSKFIVTQMNNLIQIESIMEHRGDQLDMPYLINLKDANGPLSRVKREVEMAFRKFPSVQTTNYRLIKLEGVPSKTLFGGTPWIFSITKPAHKISLFIDTMKLEALAYGKSGSPSIDKAFQEAYKETPEVSAFTKLSQLDKLKSTYVNGFYAKLKTDPDMRTDFRIRPGYGFTGTVTGRSNSYEPNLQNIPARGKFAKFIKRMFVAPRGCLTLKLDYSAHEVRMWGIISGDPLLCALFINGRWLRQQYRNTGESVYKKLMDTQGDIHKVNCQYFFKVRAEDVTPVQRNSVKSIVFGAIYGRGATAIAKQAGASVASIKTVLAIFFDRFKKASKWLADAKAYAVNNSYMYSPIWRIRNMYTQLYGLANLVAATERRGCNAPIQGFAADIGHTSGYLYAIHIERVVRMFNLDSKRVIAAGVNTFVHDSIKTDAPYEYLLVCLQVMQWCATIGVMEYYYTHWGIKFPVEVEVEFELAAHDETHWKWSWNDNNEPTVDKDTVVGGGLRFIIRKALEDQTTVYSGLDIDAIEKTIWDIRKNKPLTTYLDKHYPILSDWPDAEHIDTSSPAFKKGLGKIIKDTRQLETA